MSAASSTRTIIKAYRYRLRPTPEQEATFFQWCAAVRWVYNAALTQRNWYGRSQSDPDPHDRDSRFNAIRQSYDVRDKRLKEHPELVWLTETPSSAMTYALRDLDRAFKNFFDKRARYPSFRRARENESFTVDCFISTKSGPHMNVVMGRDSVKLPKIGRVRYTKHKTHKGRAKTATVIWDAGNWYLSVACEIPASEPKLTGKPAVGIDLGVSLPVALSNGEAWGPDEGLRRLDARKRRLQRELSRCKRGSKRRQQRKLKVGRISSHIAARRKARNHQITTDIARRFGVIGIEDLKVSNMTASAKGSAETPGRNVKAKAGLNRAILNVAPHQFRLFLTYKTEAWGGKLVAVDPAHTSQTCSQCGTVDRGSRVSQAEFSCSSCGHRENADINAAKNILERAVSGAGAGPRKTPSEHRLAPRGKTSQGSTLAGQESATSLVRASGSGENSVASSDRAGDTTHFRATKTPFIAQDQSVTPSQVWRARK
jgi:putative transposase